MNWRNPLQEARLVILEQQPGSNEEYVTRLQEYVEAQMFATTNTVRYTDGGLWFVEREGALRNAAMTANVAMRIAAYIDRESDRPADVNNLVWAHYARCFAKQQMEYIYGSTGRSFVTGWGEEPPTRPHHRAASCAFVRTGENCTQATFEQPNKIFPNILPGALVGGPDQNDVYFDDQNRVLFSEVTNDYNAALVAGARLFSRCFSRCSPFCLRTDVSPWPRKLHVKAPTNCFFETKMPCCRHCGPDDDAAALLERYQPLQDLPAAGGRL